MATFYADERARYEPLETFYGLHAAEGYSPVRDKSRHAGNCALPCLPLIAQYTVEVFIFY